MKSVVGVAIIVITVVLMAGRTHATVMLNGLGGTAGYGELVMGRNDDGSSNELDLPFPINFFGTIYNHFYVNNNGNLSFGRPLSEYTPQPFPLNHYEPPPYEPPPYEPPPEEPPPYEPPPYEPPIYYYPPMIAPYWADVDTRPSNGGEVYISSPNPEHVVATWNDVGYYGWHTDKTNDFQVVLRNRDDTGEGQGNFDIEFRYDRLEWTTGDASWGSGGLGGYPAQAGYDAGDGTNYLTLPGSGTAAVLNLTNSTNTPPNVDIKGLWVYAVRNGNPPGTEPDNPLMPVVVDEGWQFDFNIGNIDNPVYVDPLVAIGYDYFVDLGSPNFASVLLPALAFGDHVYDLWLWNVTDGDWVDSGQDLLEDIQYLLGVAGIGVDRFRILGIELPGLDPLDTSAFVTGLWFTNTGAVSMQQVPITADVVPVPGAVLLGGIGLSFAGWLLRRKTA